MRVFADYFFNIGHEHIISGKPCQDHALSFSENGLACVVVSDGCSDGRETDMGARIMTFSTVFAAQEAVAKNIPAELFHEYVLIRSRQIRIESSKLLGLQKRDMLATRVHAIATDTFAYVHVEGDGVIAWKNTSGKIFMSRFDWAHNTPCYPSYDEDSYHSFIQVQSKEDEQGLTEILYEWTEEIGFIKVSERVIATQIGVRGVVKLFTQEELNDIAFISVMSDGVTRVSGIDWKDVVKDMLSYKSNAGEFVKRRLIRMNKLWPKNGNLPLDDVACAAIWCNHEEGENYDNL